MRQTFRNLAPYLLAVGLAGFALPAFAQDQSGKGGPVAAPAPGGEMQEIGIGYIRTWEQELALSPLDIPPENIGVAGAELAIDDNNTTGSFLGQHFTLDVATLAPGDDVMPAVSEMLEAGVSYIVTDLNAEDTLQVADAAAGQGALVFNAGATDIILREAECRANMFHTAPSRAQLTDALAQYLIWKQWPDWVLISGEHEADRKFAEALKASAEKFGGNILEERIFPDRGGARATDSGVALVQRQIPTFMQGLPEHDVVLVADESEVFGTYVPWRTWVPRPVAGTAGLIPGAWHPASEQWGGRQIQNRFEEIAGRRMESKDMQAWMAIRTIGEAATRTGSNDPEAIEEFIKSPQFELAAFKGQPLSYRSWNLQLRQPIFLGDGRSVVTASPQEGFLHQASELDTLGIDEPQSACEFSAG